MLGFFVLFGLICNLFWTVNAVSWKLLEGKKIKKKPGDETEISSVKRVLECMRKCKEDCSGFSFEDGTETCTVATCGRIEVTAAAGSKTFVRGT